MYVCNYCKRNFKEKHEVCPACSGKSFSEKAYLGEVILRTPPEGGYTVSNKTFKTRLKHIRNVTLVGIIITICLVLFLAPFTLFSLLFYFTSTKEQMFLFDVEGIFLLIEILIPTVVLIITIIYNISSKKKVKKDKERIKYLANHGILVKNLPYELINDGSHINGRPLHILIKVTYENANGVKIPLISDIKYDANKRHDETVDLLIDPDNYSNYYIDYEIY